MDYQEVRYQNSHEWVRMEEESAVIGISDWAQDSLGDVVFVEFPEPGAVFDKGACFGVVESVKAASDIFMPVSGEILEVNVLLKDHPEKINQDPLGDGWLVKIKPQHPEQIELLMTSSEYQDYTKDLD